VTAGGLATEADLYFLAVVERGTGNWMTPETQGHSGKVTGSQPLAAQSFNWLFFSLSLSLALSLPPLTSARLRAAVVLNPRYPEVSPLFSISLSWKGEHSGCSDDNLRVSPLRSRRKENLLHSVGTSI